MLYLRSRYYNPVDGRFQSRDIWDGNNYFPQSLNRWNYVQANPVNFIDPTGMWRWGLPSSLYHILVENHYEGTAMGYYNPMKQLEYRIPGIGGKNKWHRVDMFNSFTGEVYEVEPWFLANSNAPGHGVQQAAQYVLELGFARDRLFGDYIDGSQYNWGNVPFHLGTGNDWPGKYRAVFPAVPTFDIVADYVQPGVISFWLEPNAGLAIPVPYLIKKYVKPENWNPQRALQPAYAFSWQPSCGTALIVIGGAIVVFTIIEDVATFGVGTFDDAVTIPGGLLFIDIGQRLAAPIIVR